MRIAYRLGTGFSFLTTEQNVALRDELDQAIDQMKEDGTLDKLIQTYITDAAATDPAPVEFTKTDGETLRVAVTGSLPPMDYVSADGTPAGFNTAVLAELGKRMNKNFELVQVDSIGRAAALSSGQVDLVFWTNGADSRADDARLTDEEFAKQKEKDEKELTTEQFELIKNIGGGIDYQKAQSKDLPEGTIMTQPYYNDLSEIIALKK